MLPGNLLLPGLDSGVMKFEYLARFFVHEVVVVLLRTGFESGKPVTELPVRGQPRVNEELQRPVHRRVANG